MYNSYLKSARGSLLGCLYGKHLVIYSLISTSSVSKKQIYFSANWSWELRSIFKWENVVKLLFYRTLLTSSGWKILTYIPGMWNLNGNICHSTHSTNPMFILFYGQMKRLKTTIHVMSTLPLSCVYTSESDFCDCDVWRRSPHWNN